MPIPDYQTLMLPVLQLAALGETTALDAEERLGSQLGLSDAERAEMLPSGKQRVFHNRIHWAKFYLQKAGLVELPQRGRFRATPEGLKLLANKPERIGVDTLERYDAFRTYYTAAGGTFPKSAARTGANTEPAAATPDDQIESAYAASLIALRSDLLERIMANSPAFFESTIVSLLVAMGYGGTHKNAAEQLGRSGDGGVDGVINEDRLGLDRVYVQAKRYKAENSIGRPEIQGFVGSLVGLGASKGVFVTTSAFSQPAADYVRHLPQRVVLIDGPMLADLMIEHQVGVRVAQVLEFKRVDEDFFLEE